MATPFLKWAGGKGKLAPAVVARAPASFGSYHEPFAGAGAVFFALAGDRPLAGATLNDLNRDLVAAYTVVRDNVEGLIKQLRPLRNRYYDLDEAGRAAMFYEVRAQHPRGAVAATARLIFLNKTCYNGLYRVNSQGEFNVPHGRYKNPNILDEANLRACSESLRGLSLTSVDFEEACDAARPGDFVYFDPPYQPLSATANFTGYTRDAFGPVEQERLARVFEDLTRRGVAALLSNSSHPFIDALYEAKGYTIEHVKMSRAINSNAAKRSAIDELLVGNMERDEVRQAFSSSPK